MATPRKVKDPDGDKRRALKEVARVVRRAEAADAAKRGAIRFAHDTGASLREISDATGIPHMTVKRLIERST